MHGLQSGQFAHCSSEMATFVARLVSLNPQELECLHSDAHLMRQLEQTQLLVERKLQSLNHHHHHHHHHNNDNTNHQTPSEPNTQQFQQQIQFQAQQQPNNFHPQNLTLYLAAQQHQYQQQQQQHQQQLKLLATYDSYHQSLGPYFTHYISLPMNNNNNGQLTLEQQSQQYPGFTAAAAAHMALDLSSPASCSSAGGQPNEAPSPNLSSSPTKQHHRSSSINNKQQRSPVHPKKAKLIDYKKAHYNQNDTATTTTTTSDIINKQQHSLTDNNNNANNKRHKQARSLSVSSTNSQDQDQHQDSQFHQEDSTNERLTAGEENQQSIQENINNANINPITTRNSHITTITTTTINQNHQPITKRYKGEFDEPSESEIEQRLHELCTQSKEKNYHKSNWSTGSCACVLGSRFSGSKNSSDILLQVEQWRQMSTLERLNFKWSLDDLPQDIQLADIKRFEDARREASNGRADFGGASKRKPLGIRGTRQFLLILYCLWGHPGRQDVMQKEGYCPHCFAKIRKANEQSTLVRVVNHFNMKHRKGANPRLSPRA